MSIDTKGRSTNADQRLGFRFEMALLYAARLHAGQVRKGSNAPYLGHLLGVAAQVIEAGGDEDQAIAALLHDAIEDQGGKPTGEAIGSLFGDGVLTIVQACSDEAPGSTERSAENWRTRKERYLKHLRAAPADVLLVSLADKLYNARAILLDLRQLGDELWRRFHTGKEEQLWYYRGLVTAFQHSAQGSSLMPLVEELDRIVSEIEKVANHV